MDAGVHCKDQVVKCQYKCIMTQEELFNHLLIQFTWIKSIIKRKNWNLLQNLIIDKPATIIEVRNIEDQLGFSLPEEYKILFTKFSKRVEFRYQFDEEPPKEYQGIFSGEIYWNLDKLVDIHRYFLEWVDASLDPSSNDAEAIEITKRLWKKKIPLMQVPNGDIIVIGLDTSEVIYFSHEGDAMHGKTLGQTLFDFLEFHSRVGFIGSEDWQFKPFFNYEQNKMVTKGGKIENFIKWLEK